MFIYSEIEKQTKVLSQSWHCDSLSDNNIVDDVKYMIMAQFHMFNFVSIMLSISHLKLLSPNPTPPTYKLIQGYCHLW